MKKDQYQLKDESFRKYKIIVCIKLLKERNHTSIIFAYSITRTVCSISKPEEHTRFVYYLKKKIY